MSLKLALSITGKFEGHDLFGNVSDNFDGMGVSAGVLQWNFGMGSLQTRILAEYMKRFNDLDKYFPEPISHLVSRGTNSEDVRWVEEHMLDGGGVRLQPKWTKAWKSFMLKPEVVELQEKACAGVEASAKKIQSSLGMDSVRSFCWAFDIVTQNGSLKGLSRPVARRTEAARLAGFSNANRRTWVRLIETASDEQLSLFILSYQRAELSNERWFQDVFSRKGTIALGKGVVHGEFWDLTPLF